ncbi:hypothetical protein SANTM175S_03940 [Streptomyces antimycoticus]
MPGLLADAPTTTASAFSSSAARARPLYGSPRKVWNSQRTSKTPPPLGGLPHLRHQLLGHLAGGVGHRGTQRRPGGQHRLDVDHDEQRLLALASGRVGRARQEDSEPSSPATMTLGPSVPRSKTREFVDHICEASARDGPVITRPVPRRVSTATAS